MFTQSGVASWVGLGLRADHYDSILKSDPPIDWFEAITENYFVIDSLPWRHLMQIKERWPVTLHGVAMSIGSADSLNWKYLHQLKAIIKRIKPLWVSDHLCWSSVRRAYLHDLLPLPHTEHVVRHVAERVRQVQDFLEQKILLENLSSYIAYSASTMTEWEFLTAVAEEADCLLLLDINNIYVNSNNHGFDPYDYINAIPPERVRQFHLAGCQPNHEVYMIDTHDAAVKELVWKLYCVALKRFGPVPTLIERDADIPPLPELVAELNKARHFLRQVCTQKKQVYSGLV